jgi:hypothetical protein
LLFLSYTEQQSRVKELKGSHQSTTDTEAYGLVTSNLDNDDMEMHDYDTANESLLEEDHELPSSQQPISSPSPQTSLSTKRYHVSSQEEQSLRSPKKPVMRSSSSTLYSGIPRPGIYSRSNSGSSSPRQNNYRAVTPDPTPDTPVFSYEKMQEFVGLHRAEMREVNDCSKRENKLLANLTLYLNSQRERGTAATMNQSFEIYLNELDEMLAHKMASIEALRDHIELIAERAANSG